MLAVLVALVLDTAFLILIMHLTGRWVGIDFGPLKTDIAKVVLFILATNLLYVWLGILALPFNLLIWIIGFKIAFRLDWTELLTFTGCYAIGSFLLRIFLLALIGI